MCSPSIVHNVHFEMFLRGCRYNSLCLNVLHNKQEVVAMMILSSYDDIIFQESRCHSPTATPADGKILSFSVVSVTGRASLGCIAWCNCSSLERERVAEKLGNPLF